MKFKIGDRAKVINCELNQPIIYLESTVTISDTHGTSTYSIKEDGYVFEEWQLELIPEHKFTTPAPEPEVAKSQQYLMDRLSEAENSKDEEWLGEKNDPRLTERGLA
jgi:hypothetical protein